MKQFHPYSMGLFEWIGEMMTPGPVGSVDVERPEPKQRSTWAILAHFGISAAGLVLLFYYIGFPHGWIGTLGCLVYVWAGTCLKPRPDYSNVGWCGGLFDHPFRLSDDINRFLMFLAVFLWPGGLIGGGFFAFYEWLRGVR